MYQEWKAQWKLKWKLGLYMGHSQKDGRLGPTVPEVVYSCSLCSAHFQAHWRGGYAYWISFFLFHEEGHEDHYHSADESFFGGSLAASQNITHSLTLTCSHFLTHTVSLSLSHSLCYQLTKLPGTVCCYHPSILLSPTACQHRIGLDVPVWASVLSTSGIQCAFAVLVQGFPSRTYDAELWQLKCKTRDPALCRLHLCKLMS